MRGSALAVALFLEGTLVAQHRIWNDHPFGDPIPIHCQRLFPAGTALADVDLDGRQDLVVGNAFSLDFPRGPMSVAVLDASWRVRVTEDCEATREPGLIAHHSIATGDFDRNGLSDLVAISDRGTLSVHLHQGPTPDVRVQKRFAVGMLTRLGLLTVINNDFVQFRTYGLEVDDFTGDGHADLALCGDARIFFESIGNTGLVVIPGDGRGGFRGEVTVALERYIACAKADVDLDGDIDLVGLGNNHELTLARSRGDARYSVETTYLSSPQRPTRLAVGDVDGDRRADYFVAGGQDAGQVISFLADTRGSPGRPVELDLGLVPGERIESMVVADMDGDDRADLAMLVAHAQANAKLLWSRNQGHGTLAAPVTIQLPARIVPNDLPPFPRYLDAVDLDGDRNPELIVASCRDGKLDVIVQIVLPNLTLQRRGMRYVGQGTAGDNGLEPKISLAGGGATLGNRSFGLLLADAPGDEARVALIMHTRHEPRLIGGVHWNVFPLFSFGTRTRGQGPGAGWARLDLPIPLAPELADYRLLFQWIVADPKANNVLGLSSTKALEVRLAPR